MLGTDLTKAAPWGRILLDRSLLVSVDGCLQSGITALFGTPLPKTENIGLPGPAPST